MTAVGGIEGGVQPYAGPLPVGETGVSKGKDEGGEGDHPFCTKRSGGRTGKRRRNRRESFRARGAAPLSLLGSFRYGERRCILSISILLALTHASHCPFVSP